MGKFRKGLLISSISFTAVLFLFGCGILIYINTHDFSQNSQNDNATDKIVKALNIDKYAPLTESLNIMVVGGDVSDVEGENNTDTIMVVNFNPKDSKISILSIPRDTKVIHNGYYRKINSVFRLSGGGEEGFLALSNKITEIMGVNIDNYVFIDTSVFRDVIDELGGIDYDVPVTMIYKDNSQGLDINLEKGEQHLNGEQAEGLVRFRKASRVFYDDYEEFLEAYEYYNYKSDLARIETQQNFLKELVSQKANVATISNIEDVVDVVFDKLVTDIDLETCIEMGVYAKDINSNLINNYTLSTIESGSTTMRDLTGYVTDNSTTEEIELETVISENFSNYEDEIDEENNYEYNENSDINQDNIQSSNDY
jgi:LCP family protein required for cell wall assembly